MSDVATPTTRPADDPSAADGGVPVVGAPTGPGGVRAAVAAVAERVWTLLAPLAPQGRALLVLGAGATALGWWGGWLEVLAVGCTCLLAVVLGLAWTARPSPLVADVRLDRRRTVVDVPVEALVTVVNRTGRPVLGGRVDVPVGERTATVDVPTLAPHATWTHRRALPVDRRAVLVVGPASAVRADPLGAARRRSVTSRSATLHVHPRTVHVPELDAGLQRDLEGRTTNDLSTTDVAFHTLRDYVPGDDRRQIHWRSSARLGTLLVRQYVDTRRLHIGLVLPTAASLWQDEAAFELAVATIGSLGSSVLAEGRTLAVVVGDRVLPSTTPGELLDGLAGVAVDEVGDLAATVATALPVVAAASIVAVAVGEPAAGPVLRRHLERLPAGAAVAAVRCLPDGTPGRATVGRTTVFDVTDLDDVRRSLQHGGLR